MKANTRRFFITGSSDGLGFLAGKLLVEQGHGIVLHARDETKARALKDKLPGCESVVVGDVSTIAEMKSVADRRISGANNSNQAPVKRSYEVTNLHACFG